MDAKHVFETARAFEEELGCTYNTLMMSKRDAGRGFALAGFHHPQSVFSRNVEYVQLTHAYNALLEFWKGEIEKKKISLFINGFKEVAVMCRALGIEYRQIYSTRYENYWYWAHDEYVEFPLLKEVFESLAGTSFEPLSYDNPYVHEQKTRQYYWEGNLFFIMLNRIFVDAKRTLYLRLKGYWSTRHYLFWEKARFHWNVFKATRKFVSPYTKPLSELKDTPYIFFPLSAEPEYSIQTLSPEYFFQQSAIASLARDAPAGTYIAVKETIWGMGRRPKEFFDQLKEFKNVVLLDVMERGLDVVKQASAVATISGSAGMEAAFLGKPVLLFGRHAGYQCVPHVHTIWREEDLKPVIDQIFESGGVTDQTREDGARLAQALKNISFDLKDYSVSSPLSFSEENVQETIDALLSSLARS